MPNHCTTFVSCSQLKTTRQKFPPEAADKADRNANNNTKISDGNKRKSRYAVSGPPQDKRTAKRLEPPAYLTDKPADIPPQRKGNTIYGGECKMASSNRSNRVEVPEAKAAMDRFKTEVASELGVNLKEGYNGDLTSREAGSIGGEMVRRMIKKQEEQMK